MASGNSPFSSGGSTSSLLRGAQSAAQKIQDYNDALADYQFQTSVKSYADWQAYDSYIREQSGSTTDPMALLKYAKKQDSARSAYISNEIQRQSINVIEGNITNPEKYNRMADLFYQASAAGQDDLAQSLHLQLDNLSVTIQNEQKAAIAANKELSAQITKDIDNQVKDAVDTIQKNANDVVDIYQHLGADKFEQTYGSDLFSVLSNMVNSQDPSNPGIVQIYNQASQSTPDADKARTYQTNMQGIAEGGSLGIKLPAFKGITYKDLQDQAYAHSIGQTLFNERTTANGVEFVKSKVTGYQWGRDENGNEVLMPIYNQQQDKTSNLKNKNGDSQLTYDQVLKNAGIQQAGSGGLVAINQGQFDKAGIARGQQVQLYVDASGNLQLINQGKAYGLNFDQTTGKYVGLQAQAPNAIDILPSGNQNFSRFNNRFFMTHQDLLNNLAPGSIGLVNTAAASGPSPVAQLETLQQSAPIPQRAFTPQPKTVNPQSGAISPIGLPANTQIQIAKPQPLPTITIAKPKPLPTLTVTQAKPQKGGLSVGAPRPNPKIKF